MNTPATTARKWLSYSDPHGKDGQALVEYCLIMILVFLACLAAVTSMGGAVEDKLWSMFTLLPF